MLRPPQSFWTASAGKTGYPALEQDVTADAAVIGGGLAGISIAYLLKREGLTVAVVEADRLCRGTTAHSTAKVTSQHALIYNKIISKMGSDLARQYADANEYAIGLMKEISRNERIECDFEEQPAYVITMEDKYIREIQDEAEAAASLGLKAQYLDTVDLPFKVKAALRFDGQAQFHPSKYVLGLAKKIPEDGSYIFENTRALDIQQEENSLRVLTDGKGSVTARFVIIATHYPFYDGYGMYFSRIYPDRSYVVAVKARDKYPGGMYITAEDPGRSLRSAPSEDGELILVGGEHHKTGQGEDMAGHYIKLAEFSRRYFDVTEIPYRWSTQDYTSMDEVPYIGPLTQGTPNIFVATGFRKWGMTGSTVAGLIIRDLILKGDSQWAQVYSPLRFKPAASAKKFVSENANVAAHLISGKLAGAPADIKLQKGEGKTVEIDNRKVGAYKDEKDRLHLVSSSCTHMGCELRWNSAERSWDCPCHGSRFTYEGEIIEGPALKTIKAGSENRQ